MQKMYNFCGANQLHDIKPTAKKIALEIGFDSLISGDITSSVSELIQSISALGDKYNFSMRIIKNSRSFGLEFMVNVKTDYRYKNNFSINGHLGSGFENIKRKMDDFCISSSGGELVLITRKWLPVA